MITKTIPGSENYQCKIVKISEYRKHPNADRLFIVNVDHNNVITGVEPTLGDLYVYFPVLSKINPEFLSFINGFDKAELNRDQSVKGFFTSKCRVKPIKLRGLPSEGYLHPLKDLESFLEAKKWGKVGTIEDAIDWIGLSLFNLNAGDEFNEVEGILICDKYTVVKASSNNSTAPKGKSSSESNIVDGQFAFHGTTDQLRKNLHRISPDDLIEISYKKHGTSLVVSNILTKRKLSWLEKLGAKIGVKVKDQDYGIVISSRKVIKTETNKGTGYYKSDIWTEAGNKLKGVIPKGYSLYCEIIGYVGDSYIQKGYDYGCAPGEFKTYIYKITHTNPDGFVINLTANQIKQFCEKYALLFSDTLRYYGYASALYPDLDPDSTTWREEFLERLEKEFTEKDCIMCVNKVPEEGVVLVKENMFEYEAFKLKSHAFLMYEDKQLEAEEVNLEDNQH